MKKVEGRRSPRWSINAKMTIPCKDGLVYLVRRRLIQTPFFGVFVHDIHEDDGDRDPHNHPWSFISIVLRGEYTERVYEDPVYARDLYALKTHRRLSFHRMGQKSAHRIVKASPGLKTLIIVGPRSKDGWGFFVQKYVNRGEYVDWATYEEQIGTI